MNISSKKLANGKWVCYATIDGFDYSFEGKSYPSMKHAAAAFGIKYETLMNHFRPGRKNKTNLRMAS